MGLAARKYVTEFIGSFFLTFAVGVAALSGSVFVPLAAGATLMVMVYAGGHISGGHYNPAVTMAALARRRIGIRDAVPYWIAQAVGGVAAGALACAVVNPATGRPRRPGLTGAVSPGARRPQAPGPCHPLNIRRDQCLSTDRPRPG